MKQSIWEKIKRNERKMALCLMMAGLSAFSVGFTNSNNGIEVEKVKTIQEISADNFSVAGKDALIQTAEFVNTTREIASENPAEVSIKPINTVEGVENLTYEENINENIEQQAQAIFKSWFVDFEPFSGIMPDDWNTSN
ncbi:MAG: hypothetical protein IJQ16_04575, partial [Selenomonadaceae bacterium]|nr:hypothetical protein [Selenomonadaceae bacterium]